jgi:polyhydroxybutyrate depolymerase
MLYIPEEIKENAMVFMLHGYTSNAADMMSMSHMNAVAGKYGFAVVYPQGLYDIGYDKSATCWNCDLTTTDTDDIGFLISLAAYLQKTYGFSPEKTFAAGFSNGGFMCYKLACDAPNTFRAVASVSGTMSGRTWECRDPSVFVPLLQIHGESDNIVPIDGSMAVHGGWGGAPALSKIIDYWNDANSTNIANMVSISDKATAYRYSSVSSDNLVWYYVIEDFGHDWPQQENAGFNAEEAIWEFFSNYVN